MAITYTLKPTELQTVPQLDGQTNVVVCVHWAYVGEDGGRTAAFGGSTNLSIDSGTGFTPFDKLTEEQVAGWVLASWSDEETATRRAAIAEQLTVSTPTLPWAPAPSEAEAPTND